MSFLGRYGYKVLKHVKEPVYHGPKKRALDMFLRFPPKQILSAEDAVKYVWRKYPKLTRQVHRITPYPNVQVKDNFVNILLVWVGHFAEARDTLFDDAGSVVKETGWYPAVTGEFHFSYKSSLENLIRSNVKKLEDIRGFKIGKLISIQTVVRGSDGTCFLVRTSETNWMLDFGLRFGALIEGHVDCFVLSHIHRDHAGGLVSAFQKLHPRLIIMSEETLRHLCDSLREDNLDRFVPDIVRRTFCPPLQTKIDLQSGSLVFSDANHMDGALTIAMIFEDGKSLLYTGDCSFRNVFDNSNISALTNYVPSSCISVALVDATLVGRTESEASRIESNEFQFGQDIRNCVEFGGHTLVLSERVDDGVRLYLMIYDLLMQGPNKLEKAHLYMDSEVYLFLLRASINYLRSQEQKLDPRLSKLFKARKNPIETVMLFKNNYGKMTVRNLKYHAKKKRGLIFINTMYSLEKLESLYKQAQFRFTSDDKVFIIGRIAESKKLLNRLANNANFKEADFVTYSGFEWSQHTSEDALREVLASCRWAKNVYLFHNWPEILTDFISSIDNDSVTISAVPDTITDFSRLRQHKDNVQACM